MIAGLALALTLPWLLFALPAGALTDRVDRRRVMLAANTIRGCLLAALAVSVAAGAGSIWVLCAAAFCIGTAETIYDTSAQSIHPQVVGPRQLPRANGLLFAAETTSNQFIAPPLGGLLVTAGAADAGVADRPIWIARRRPGSGSVRARVTGATYRRMWPVAGRTWRYWCCCRSPC